MQNSEIINILFIGDIIGRPGRKSLKDLLPQIKEEFSVDFTICNGENSAAGFGITEKVLKELLSYGIDVITSGNHIWDKKEGITLLDKEYPLLRPANYNKDMPGNGYIIKSVGDGYNVCVINLQGRVFMSPINCPFKEADLILDEIKDKSNIIIVDFHAEATSEKRALGWYLDGRVSAVIGTHTHVQTADEEILPKGTAYITDAGMCGGFESIIGMNIESSLFRMINNIPKRMEPSKKDIRFNGVVVSVNRYSGKAENITRINRRVNGDETS